MRRKNVGNDILFYVNPKIGVVNKSKIMAIRHGDTEKK